MRLKPRWVAKRLKPQLSKAYTTEDYTSRPMRLMPQKKNKILGIKLMFGYFTFQKVLGHIFGLKFEVLLVKNYKENIKT